jgi:hypothetical protein
MIDDTSLDITADDLTGPTVGELARAKRTDDLMQQVLSALVNPAPPAPVNVQVAAPEMPQPQVVVNAAPRTAWTFEFIRNPDGTVRSIKATPKDAP